MPIQHMVLVKFKPDVTKDRVAELIEELQRFWASMPGITYFAGGPYASPEGLNQGFTHGFLVSFDAAASRDAYLVDPRHQQIVQMILPHLENVLAFDFVSPPGGGAIAMD